MSTKSYGFYCLLSLLSAIEGHRVCDGCVTSTSGTWEGLFPVAMYLTVPLFWQSLFPLLPIFFFFFFPLPHSPFLFSPDQLLNVLPSPHSCFPPLPLNRRSVSHYPLSSALCLSQEMKNLNKHTLSGSLYPSRAPCPTASPCSLPFSFILFWFSQHRCPDNRTVHSLSPSPILRSRLHPGLIARCFSRLKLQHLGAHERIR